MKEGTLLAVGKRTVNFWHMQSSYAWRLLWHLLYSGTQ